MSAQVEGRRVLAANPLARRSIEVLREGQAASGAYVAAPTFPVYQFAWLRDGAFCAHAMDLAGERASAAAFHRWVAARIFDGRERVDKVTTLLARGETPSHATMLPARYTLDGDLEPHDSWPNFQLDGYGMWLWALGEHARDGVEGDVAAAVEITARYLSATWQLPCYGCWEEFDDGRHACTLAAVAAGLVAAARLLHAPDYAAEAGRIRAHLLANFVRNERFRRCATDDRVDGSLLWLSVPFGVLDADDPRIAATVAAVRRDLVGPAGGVRRYLGDTYYGGGEWILLTCSLAWHDAVTGNAGELERCRSWVQARAHANGDLPEQATEHAQVPEMVDYWVKRWGPVAKPLLWSHAMYVIMEVAAAQWSSSR